MQSFLCILSDTVQGQVALGFPMGRNSATFRDSGTGKTFLSWDKGTTGQKFLHCPGTKGQPDKLNILLRDGIHIKTGQSRKGLSKTEKGCSKTEKGHSKTGKDVLKQESDVLKQEKMFSNRKLYHSLEWGMLVTETL